MVLLFSSPLLVGSQKYHGLLDLSRIRQPNGDSTLIRRRFDIDIMSIDGRLNFDKFPRHFYVLFRCNFADRKIHVVFTYFFRYNFDGRNIHVFSTNFFRCNFDVPKIHVVSTWKYQCNFSGQNFDGQKFDVGFGSDAS